MFRAQPFQNDLIVMNLTGQQIKQLLEQQFTATISERPRLLGVSVGFSYQWDGSRPVGERVQAMRLNGAALVPALQYRVTVNGYAAGGAEGLTAFREGSERQVSVLDLEALVSFLQDAAAVTPYQAPPLNRITRLR